MDEKEHIRKKKKQREIGREGTECKRKCMKKRVKVQGGRTSKRKKKI